MTDRIQIILKSMNLSPSQFADGISVQRSSVSHILSGRNKPSLDFITKVLTSYPEISSDWLLFGTGTMMRKAGKQRDEEPREAAVANETPGKEKPVVTAEMKQEIKPTKKQDSVPVGTTEPIKPDKEKEISEVIIFYRDNTFKPFRQER